MCYYPICSIDWCSMECLEMRCRACGEKLTNTNEHHTFQEPIKVNGKMEPNPVIICNIHNVPCGEMR